MKDITYAAPRTLAERPVRGGTPPMPREDTEAADTNPYVVAREAIEKRRIEDAAAEQRRAQIELYGSRFSPEGD